MPRLALLFDLDGTLIDSIERLLQSMTFAFATRSDGPTRAQRHVSAIVIGEAKA